MHVAHGDVAIFRRTVHVDPIPSLGVSDVIDRYVVVSAPEEWHLIESFSSAEHVARCGLALTLGNNPVLDTDRCCAVRVRPPRNVPGRIDVLGARLEVLVDNNAILDTQPSALREPQSRPHADADDHEVGAEPLAICERDGIAGDRFGRLSEVEDDAMLLMQGLDELPEITAHDPLEGNGLGCNNMNGQVRMARPQRGGNLETDEARPEDNGLLRAAGRGDDRAAITQRSKVVDVRQVGARNR